MDKDLLDLANSRIDAVQSLASWILPATAILAALFICVCLALLLAATRGLERLTELAAEQAPDPTDPLAGMRLAEAVAKEDLLGPALKEGVAGYRTWHLAGHAPPSGLFGGRIRRQLAKFESMARYIGASLTILGLLFTFIGMQYVVENVRGLVSTDPAALSEEEDSDSFERSAEDITRSVLSNVAGSLGGMDLAFRSSIHGIIYGLLVLLALHVFRIYRDSRLAKLNDLVVMRIAPVFVPTEPDRQADHFIEHTQQLVANAFSQVEDNSTRVMDKLEAQNREFVEKLVASIQGLVKESIEDLRRTSDEGIAALRGGSEEFVKKLAETSEAQSAQVLKRHAVTEQALLQATDQSLTKVSKSLQELSSAMIQTQATSTQEVARTLQQASRAVSSQIDAIAANASDVVRASSKATVDSATESMRDVFGELQERLKSQTEAVGGMSEGLSSSLKALTDHIARIDHLQAKVLEIQERTGETIAVELREGKVAISTELSNATTQVNESFSVASKALVAGVTGTMTEGFQGIGGGLEASVGQFLSVSEKLVDVYQSLDSTSKSIEESAGAFDASGQVIKRTGDLMEKVDKSLGGMEETLGAVVAVSKQLEEQTLEPAFDDLFKVAGGLQKQLRDLREPLVQSQQAQSAQSRHIASIEGHLTDGAAVWKSLAERFGSNGSGENPVAVRSNSLESGLKDVDRSVQQLKRSFEKLPSELRRSLKTLSSPGYPPARTRRAPQEVTGLRPRARRGDALWSWLRNLRIRK